jgi:O-antigen ligase
VKLTLNRVGIFLAPIFLILLTFSIPLGFTLKSVFLVGAIVTLLITPYYNQYLAYAYHTLWGRAALVFFIFIVVSCFWSPASYSMQLSIIGKYSKLLYLPFFAVGFINPKTRYWAIHGFLLAMCITAVISILKAHNTLTCTDPGAVFYNHIITGFMMVLASYISGLFVFESKGKFQLFYGVIFILASYQLLFINTGRTGYVLYSVLIVLLLLQKLTFKKAILSVFLFSGCMAIIYNQSAIMHSGVKELVSDIRVNTSGTFQLNGIKKTVSDVTFTPEKNTATSVGLRMQFHDYAQSLFLKHPLKGVGAAGLKYSSFSDFRDRPIPSWGNELNEPHSQYWMTLAEQGLIGGVLLVLFLGSLFFSSLQLHENKEILLGVLVAFCLGAFSDTILCYSAAGYVLIVMSALCFGELIERHALSRADTRIQHAANEPYFIPQ